jgi:hypothetical protein
MAQTNSYEIENDSGAVVRGRMNEVFSAIQSSNAGQTPPPNPEPGMLWLNTSVTPSVLFRRNAANDEWIALLDAAGVPAYQFVSTVQFTSSGTFDKADYPWLRAIRVRCQGGGGQAGGVNATTASQAACSGGGAGGSYAESFITDIDSLDASVTVTVGAGGSGAAAGASGNDGGASSFGSLVVANGGAKGFQRAATSGINASTGGAGSASGSVGQIVVSGGGGGGGLAVASGEGQNGIGGGSVLGGGGRQVRTGADQDLPGNLYGGGGSGGSSGASEAAKVGSSGAPGIVILELFA